MTDIVERLESVEFMGMPDGVLDYSTASEAAARIKALEARIAKADALADALEAYNRGGAGPLTYWLDVEKFLAAYREGSDT